MENIQLAKARDMGQTIGDPFLFTRHNFKLLFRAYLYYVVPPLLVAAALMIFGFKGFFERYSQTFNSTGGFNTIGNRSGFANLGISLVLGYGLFVLISLFQQFYVSEFMVLKEDREDVSNSDVLERLKNDWKNIVVSVLFLILVAVVAIALIFLVFASSVYVGTYVSGFTVFLLYLFLLYAMLPLSNFIFIRLREREGVFGAIAQAFRISSGSWWRTFISFLVVFIVFYSLIILLLIPFYIMVGIVSYHAASSGIRPDISSMYLNPVSGVVLTLATFVSFFLQNIITVFVGINYYSLSEKYSNFHLRKEINQIGEREDKTVRRQEGEY
jgi:hypothetical protein